jgi:signal transduction histidine kinase
MATEHSGAIARERTIGLRALSQLLAALALAYSTVTLLAWWFNIGPLKTILPGAVPIHPHTAATFIVLSCAVFISSRMGKWPQRLALSFAVFSATVGSLRLIAMSSGHSLWLGDPYPEQKVVVMAAGTATVFVCLGVASICVLAPRGTNWTFAVALSLVAIGLGGAASFGHLLEIRSLYSINHEVMSLPTAILTLLVGFSLITSRPSHGIVSTAIEHISSKWLDLPIRYKCFAMAALPVACLIFEIGWQFRVLRDLNVSQQWIAHTQEVQLTVADLQRLLLNIESNDRGFGLSGSEEFLVPLSQEEAEAAKLAQRLSVLVEDNPLQSARARDLGELTRLKVDFARDVVGFFTAHRNSPSTPVMRMRLLESKARMEQVIELSRVFAAEEQRLLSQRMSRVSEQQQLSQRILAFTVVTGIGTGIFTILIFSWSIANRLTALKRDSLYLARGEIIRAPASGKDELSSLAWALHSASHKIYDQMRSMETLNSELESFSYSVSHDLRSPLRHIHGFSKILTCDYSADLPAEARRYLSRIERGAERMGQLIDDLLNFSRIGRRELDRHSVPLLSTAQSIVEEVNETSTHKIEWHIHALPTVEGDPGLIKQIFANLLGNAAKFSRTREHPVIEVGSRVLPQGTAIYVRDNGVGFDMKFADKLFGVFQRLHRMEDFEGTGVGLATVARIVHKHGGTVWAESAPDHGATFYFTLGEPVVSVPVLRPKVRTQTEVVHAATH